MRTTLFAWVAVVALWVLCTSAVAQTVTLSFDEPDLGLKPGVFLGSQYLSKGVTISAESGRCSGYDVATLFDSDGHSKPDKDLQRDWLTGNLSAANPHLGNLLIITENMELNDEGLIAAPDDEAAGGKVTFAFANPVTSLGFDLLSPVKSMKNTSSIKFYDGDTFLFSIPFTDLPCISYGDNTANRIAPILAASHNFTSFDRVVFKFGGSVGLDNVNFVPLLLQAEVPEPSSAALLLLLPAYALRRYRS